MNLSYHGGRCCGIKHIWGMTNGPETVLNEQGKQPGPGGVGETNWAPSMYGHVRPKETAAARLDALIEFSRLNWPEHIIEVVCADTAYAKQAKDWNDALVERGFKEVNRNINSNSTNTVVVYHLNVNDKKVDYKERLKTAIKSTPTIFHIQDDGTYGTKQPLKGTRKKPDVLPEPVEVTIDGFVMVMAPEGGDVATPKPQSLAQRVKAALA